MILYSDSTSVILDWTSQYHTSHCEYQTLEYPINYDLLSTHYSTNLRELIPTIYTPPTLKLVEHNRHALEYITVDIMSDHSDQEKPEGSDSTNLHVINQMAQVHNDELCADGALSGASGTESGSQPADVVEPGITADLQSDIRTTDQYSEYHDDHADVDHLPLPNESSDSEDQRTVTEVPTKNIEAPTMTPTTTTREEGEENAEMGEETDEEAETTAEATAETTGPATVSKGAAAKASAKGGRRKPPKSNTGKLKGVSKKDKVPPAPARTQPYRTGKTTTSHHKTGQSDTPPPYSLGHVSTTGNTDSHPLQGSYPLADLQAQSNFPFLMGRLSASGEVGAALSGLSVTQSSSPQEPQLPEKGGRLPPSYDNALKEAKKATISVKVPSLSDKLAALKQKGVSLLEERPGFEAIFNSHRPEHPHREQLDR